MINEKKDDCHGHDYIDDGINPSAANSEVTAKTKDSLYWPLPPSKWALWYMYFMFFHSAAVLIFWVARIAFEDKPGLNGVRFEWYLDFIFLIDMLRIFNQPIFTETGKKILDR
jgi:hypothetical protein